MHSNLTSQLTKIAVFCGSKKGYNPTYVQAVQNLAQTLTTSDITLVYGGTKVGLMGVLADEMLRLGGEVIGVISQRLAEHFKVAHDSLTTLHVINHMYEGKHLMHLLADGFIMLPGSIGSLDEFFEMVTLQHLGYHDKPCGILNTNGYYNNLIKFLDHAVNEGFLPSERLSTILIEDEPQKLLEKMLEWKKQVLSLQS